MSRESYACKDDKGGTILQDVPCQGLKINTPTIVAAKPVKPQNERIASQCKEYSGYAYNASMLRQSGVSVDAVLQPNASSIINGIRLYAFINSEKAPKVLKQEVLNNCLNSDGPVYIAGMQKYYIEHLPKRKIDYAFHSKPVFLNGMNVYKKENLEHPIGEVVDVSNNHEFPNEKVEPGVLIDFGYTKAWVTLEAAEKLYTPKAK